MSAVFFDKPCGRAPNQRVLVHVNPEKLVIVDLNRQLASQVTSALAPADARELGRALIKAGKFAEKDAKK